LTFAFSPKALEGLKFANFNLLSLANNHTLNMGENGLKQTREFLEKENINFTGDPIDCTGKFIYKENNIIFLAFNKTFNSSCGDEKIVETVQSIKSQEPEKFLVVSLHWGQEYQTKSSVSQKNLAHKIIAAGADLIIGHHPHVVQEIEIYKNKLIFYSLGNFIFDQYFSEETQEGLAVGLEIWPDKNIFLLFPIQSEMSQPFLMEQKEKEIFLKNLAGMSSGDLIGQIEKGKLEIKIEQIAE
jgi:poly-gamma-glutamate synthesis protein (capsule biosynthesis protein)